MKEAKQFVCSWQDFWQSCDLVADSITKKNQSYSMAIAIVRGGYYLGDYLCRRLNIPLGVIVAKSYSENTKQQQTLSIGQLSCVQRPYGKILLVDDLVDSGGTLETIKKKLIKEYGVKVDTAVIWQKSHSQFKPDYYHRIIPQDCWIVQPFEKPISND